MDFRFISCKQSGENLANLLLYETPLRFSLIKGINETAHGILVLIALPSNEGSDESVHMHRLARAFPARIYNIWTYMKTQTKM